MSAPDHGSATSKGSGVKTLAIRLEPELHAELSLIAQLREQTITDEIRQAIESHIAAIKADPDLATKADDVLADIERQAAARRDAFARLFSEKESTTAAAATTAPTPPAKEPRGRRSSSPAQ